MSGNRRVAALVLVLFTLLPVSGTLCALVCDFAAPVASARHGADKHCEEVAPATTGVQLAGASDHDCSKHDTAIRQVASTVLQRVELKAPAIVVALPAGHRSFSATPLSTPALVDTGPPGAAPRTSTPLVLRV